MEKRKINRNRYTNVDYADTDYIDESDKKNSTGGKNNQSNKTYFIDERDSKVSADWKEPEAKHVKRTRPQAQPRQERIQKRRSRKKTKQDYSWIGALLVGLLTVLMLSFLAGRLKSSQETVVSGSVVQDSGTASSLTAEETAAEVPEQVLRIKPIAQMEQNIPTTEGSVYMAGNVSFLEYSGTIASDGQEDRYSFTASENGTYRCEMSGMLNGFNVWVVLYNELGEDVDHCNGAGNGEGVTTSLQAGQTYTLGIRSWSGTGSYMVKVGQAKAAVDISAYTAVQDAIEYKGQEVYYAYTPGTTGKHRFEIAQMNQGSEISIYIYDDAGYEIDRTTGIGQGYGLTTDLNAGQLYWVIVKQYSDVGAYTMNIGAQKAAMDISKDTVVCDSMIFRGQENQYSFTAKETGTYRFEISRINNGVSVSMQLLDMAGYTAASSYDLGKNQGITAELEAGQTYQLAVSQYSDYGSYTMLVGAQKKPLEISTYSRVEDSIQFREQTNCYTYRPAADGNYVFAIETAAADLKLSVKVSDDEGYLLAQSSGMRAGNSMEAELEAGREYRVTVLYYDDYGDYTLCPSLDTAA